MSDTLFLIPARGGSKGVPGKNIKLLNGVPLINYSVSLARQFSSDDHICVSTDDISIKSIVEDTGLKVPFIRPAQLASDEAGMYEVLIHALNYYESIGKKYQKLVLLQPTSPFRKKQHLEEALKLYQNYFDMVVSVMLTKSNPYFKLMKEEDGYLRKILEGDYTSRQSAPEVFELNGAIYIISVSSLREMTIGDFKKVKKYQMDELSSIDIDTKLDWDWAELLISKNIIKPEIL
ncbi:MAG: acylneuraminate cytidylyltransferase family protein [Cytophagaceae bacterium]|nr:acylneuraminate cytidylyltransferase family protein [Cytophagaceae bacterium]